MNEGSIEEDRTGSRRACVACRKEFKQGSNMIRSAVYRAHSGGGVKEVRVEIELSVGKPGKKHGLLGILAVLVMGKEDRTEEW